MAKIVGDWHVCMAICHGPYYPTRQPYESYSVARRAMKLIEKANPNRFYHVRFMRKDDGTRKE